MIITRIFYFINNLITVLRWKNLRFSELGVIHSLRGQTIVTFVLSLEIPHYFQVFIGKSQDPDYKAFSSQVRRSSSFFHLKFLIHLFRGQTIDTQNFFHEPIGYVSSHDLWCHTRNHIHHTEFVFMNLDILRYGIYQNHIKSSYNNPYVCIF